MMLIVQGIVEISTKVYCSLEKDGMTLLLIATNTLIYKTKAYKSSEKTRNPSKSGYIICNLPCRFISLKQFYKIAN